MSPILREELLSYRDTMGIRALMIILIVIYHAGLLYGIDLPNDGHICVAVFFFMSGWGLELSIRNKQSYLATFLQKRVFGLLIQYWIIMISTVAVTSLMYLSWNEFGTELLSVFLDWPHWYVSELLVFYILFYVLALSGTRYRLPILALTTVTSMLLMAEYFETNLYLKSGMAFVFGVVLYHYKDSFRMILERNYWLPTLSSLLVSALCFRGDSFYSDIVFTGITCISVCTLMMCTLSLDIRRSTWAMMIILVLSSIVFCIVGQTDITEEGAFMGVAIVVAAILVQTPVIESALGWWGKMSFELYLLHHMFLVFLYDVLELTPLVSIILTFVLMTVLSYAVHCVNSVCLNNLNSKYDSIKID